MKKGLFIISVIIVSILSGCTSSPQERPNEGSPDNQVRGLQYQGRTTIQKSHNNDVNKYMKEIRQKSSRNKNIDGPVSEEFKSQLPYLFTEMNGITPEEGQLYLFTDKAKPRSGSIYFISYSGNKYIVSRYKIIVRRGSRFDMIYIPEDFE